MDGTFVRQLEDRARTRRARIGIGVWKANPELTASLLPARQFADLVVVGEANPDCGLDVIASQEPWRDLPRLLFEGQIYGISI